MQQAIFTAHCPYELGDIVEVAIIEGMAITGYPRRLGTAEMQITDIITEHSLKNGTVSSGWKSPRACCGRLRCKLTKSRTEGAFRLLPFLNVKREAAHGAFYHAVFRFLGQ